MNHYVKRVCLITPLILTIAGCGGGSKDNTDQGNTVVSTTPIGTAPPANDTSNQNPTTQPDLPAAPDPQPDTPPPSEFSALTGIWDTSIQESDGLGGSGTDEQYMVIRTDGTVAIYDYESDGFGSGHNCYTRDTFRFIPESTPGNYTVLPDDPTTQREVINISATTNFLNITDLDFEESTRAERETQFVTEAEFTPVCTAEQQYGHPGDEGTDTSTGGNGDGDGGGDDNNELTCDTSGSNFDWRENCSVSQFEYAISSYTTAIQGILWCQGFGTGTRDEFIDGVFGPITENAVLSYQLSSFNFLEATGGVNSSTWSDLQQFGIEDTGNSRYSACDDVFFEYTNNQWYVGITGGFFQSMSAN